jgi:hypothetical protein
MKHDGLYIEFLVGGDWRNDTTAGLFVSEYGALVYLQSHLERYPHSRLKIGTRLYEVRADGLYVMTARKGWQLLEGVEP